MALVHPPHNRIGAVLLDRLLRLALEGEGCRIEFYGSGAWGLNDYFTLFRVDNLARGLSTVRRELEALGILDQAQIGWMDWRELVWRCWWPAGGEIEPPSAEALEMEWRLMNAVLGVLLSRVARDCARLASGEPEKSGGYRDAGRVVAIKMQDHSCGLQWLLKRFVIWFRQRWGRGRVGMIENQGWEA